MHTKSLTRFTAPSIETLVRGIENDNLDLEMAMADQEKHSLEAAMSSKSWRALRAASRSSFGLLEKIGPTHTLQEAFMHDSKTGQEPISDAMDIAALGGKEDQISAA